MYRVIIKTFLLGLFAAIASCKSDTNSTSRDTAPAVGEKSNIKTDDRRPTILFFGNSLTAGYGLEPEQSFPSLIEDKLADEGYRYAVVNAGLSGETTSGGLNRIDWVLSQPVDIFFLELGANDMLRGLPVEETKTNLTKIIETVQSKYPKAKVALCQMMAPPNMGVDYERAFNSVYVDVANSTGAELVPFFLQGVVGHPDLILPDGKHPNAEGQKVVAEHIWQYLENML